MNFAHTNVVMTSIAHFEFIDFVQLCVEALFEVISKNQRLRIEKQVVALSLTTSFCFLS